MKVRRWSSGSELNEADLVLLMPVRITQAKNIEFALQVTASLKSKNIRPKLVVTGPPDPHDPEDMAYYQSLLELRQKLGVEREVRFVYSSGPQRTVVTHRFTAGEGALPGV